MARLALAPSASLKSLGAAVLNASDAEFQVKSSGGDPSLKDAAEDAIRMQFAQELRSTIKFHYDDETTNNVVIPFLGSDATGFGDPNSKLGKMAAEAIGMIVIFGCAN